MAINTINKATKESTNTYFYDVKKDRFGVEGAEYNHGFIVSHAIIVDAGLSAQELDSVFDEAFKEIE